VREVAVILAGLNRRTTGRRELVRICAPRLAAAPASAEKFVSLAAGRAAASVVGGL